MEPCSHRKVFSGKPNYQQPPRPHNFEWICSKCHAVGYQAQIVSGHEHPEDDDYVDQDLFAQLKPLAKYEMRTITVKEALELMFAGEVVSAAIVKPMIEGNIPPLHRFRIVDGVVFIFADKPIYKATFWEQYHCAINTFLGFDFFVPKAEEIARYVGPNSETVVLRDSNGSIHNETLFFPNARMINDHDEL